MEFWVEPGNTRRQVFWWERFIFPLRAFERTAGDETVVIPLCLHTLHTAKKEGTMPHTRQIGIVFSVSTGRTG